MNLEKYERTYEKFCLSAQKKWLQWVLIVLATAHLLFVSKAVQAIVPRLMLEYFIYGTPIVIAVLLVVSCYFYKNYFLNAYLLILLILFGFISRVGIIALESEGVADTHSSLLIAMALFAMITYLRTFLAKGKIEAKLKEERDLSK